ncbi:STAS domain-containing protein [Aquabacterium sp.]|uniref:STAS domain-containing protein n=1 Tax=Aquabacterium sp. TaxID=1872578 RepID=UPI0025BB2EA3|nr:STAS domain-containing protein [Aquabacterium sp.]MBI3382223.1 STAS domain-containing protein [Aquabacterium sp.]
MSITLTLDGELTVFTAEALKQRLLSALSGDAELLVDASAVAEVDGAGVQLLLAAQKAAAELGGGLTLQSATPPLIEALTLTDLLGEFRLTAPTHTQEHA